MDVDNDDDVYVEDVQYGEFDDDAGGENDDPQLKQKSDTDLRDEIHKFTAKFESVNTKRKMRQSVNRFEKWLASEGVTEKLENIPLSRIDLYISHWLMSLQKLDGGEYEPDTVSSHATCIRKHVAQLKVCDAVEDFPRTAETLRAKRKSLKSMGKGNKPNKADALSPEDEERLWATGALGDSSPETLIHTVFFLFVKNFGLRGCSEPENMRWGDVKFGVDNDGDEYLQFGE